jgi:hypothetical protein
MILMWMTSSWILFWGVISYPLELQLVKYSRKR